MSVGCCPVFARAAFDFGDGDHGDLCRYFRRECVFVMAKVFLFGVYSITLVEEMKGGIVS